MNFTSSSITKDDNERLKQREKTTFNRFLSFNENKLSSVKNYHQSILNFIEFEEENLNKNLSISFSHKCDQCSKIFASEYGLNYHINMYHPNQSIICSDCNNIFRSHRALKNHQQRFHTIYSQDIPNYNYISSYLVIAFSTEQFTFIAKNACEQKYLPLGKFSSELFQCQLCNLSFPCSNALKYHRLNKHEQYEYNLCKNILYDIILQIEQNLRTVDDDNNIESIKFLFAKQASHFGLIDKQLLRESRSIKHEHNHLIFPKCQHQNRTCANLCLKYLSSYNKLIHNYPYKISTLPKGNPFAQGSIVSKLTNGSFINTSIISKEGLNSNQKRTSLKRVKSSFFDGSSSPQSKRKHYSTIEQQFQTNEIKSFSIEQSSSKKILPKMNHNYARSLSSMSSNSSTSTRTSSKNSRQQTITSLKRSISPTITLAVERSSEKRRRQREQRKAKTSSSSVIITKIDDDIEQENDDDDIISIECEQQRRNKQRRASSSSVEYVQILDNDQQSLSSLNNIENLKLKSQGNNEEILVCHSSPSVKKPIPSPNKDNSKTSVNGIHKVNGHQTSDYDEHVRVRCKICGEILEGRSRFSKHVLTMHSHLLKTNISDIKQQHQQTTIVR